MNIRHGDCGLIGIDKLPKGLTASKSNVLMTGSGGNDHMFTMGIFYPHADGQTVGYFVAVDGAKLLHPEHGQVVNGRELREVDVTPGIYQIIKQVEQTHGGMRPVED